MKRKNLFSEMTVLEIRTYLETKDAILIPVAGLEQHGHHLPVCTDSLIAEGMAEGVAERLDLLYLPYMPFTYSGGTLPGTINFNPTTLLICLKDLCTSLAQQGFRNQFILLGHAGSENFTMLKAGLSVMIRENPAFDEVLVALFPFWQYCDLFMDGFRAGDGHGGNGETSLILHMRPDLVTETVDQDGPEVLEGMRKHPDYYQKHEKPYDAPEVLARITQKDAVRVGVMGDIGGATATLGRSMMDEAVGKVAARIEAFMAGRSREYAEIHPELPPIVL